jgi:Flagellar biosynthesis protein, FliO
MIRMAKSDARRQGAPQTGLAAWMLTWLRIPLLARFPKLGNARAERRMELVEVLGLGGKRQLMMVVCDGRRYLLGTGSDSVHSIAEMAAEAAPSELTGKGLDGDSLGVSARGPAEGTERGL